MRKFTVFFDQINRINYQILAEDKDEAIRKAKILYKRNMFFPDTETQEGWISERDGEDK